MFDDQWKHFSSFSPTVLSQILKLHSEIHLGRVPLGSIRNENNIIGIMQVSVRLV